MVTVKTLYIFTYGVLMFALITVKSPTGASVRISWLFWHKRCKFNYTSDLANLAAAHLTCGLYYKSFTILIYNYNVQSTIVM